MRLEFDRLNDEPDALGDRVKLAALVLFVALIVAIVVIVRPNSALLNVSTGGIHEPADVARLQAANVSAYLVGSAFMAANEPGRELQRVFSGA